MIKGTKIFLGGYHKYTLEIAFHMVWAAWGSNGVRELKVEMVDIEKECPRVEFGESGMEQTESREIIEISRVSKLKGVLY